MDEHRIGFKPLLRRVWAPIGQRPIAVVRHRFAWRYMVGFVHPASGRTIFHLATSVSIPLFEAELAAFARAAGASPQQADRAGAGPSRLAYQCASAGPRACPSALSPAVFARTAARRTSVAVDQHRAHQPAFRHHRRAGGGATGALRRVAAAAGDDPLDDLFSLVASADPQTTRTQKELGPNPSFLEPSPSCVIGSGIVRHDLRTFPS